MELHDFPLKSYIRTKSKWVKKKEKEKRRIPKKEEISNQTERIKSKKNVSVHPDIELEKTSHHLGLGYKACLHFFPPLAFHVCCLLTLFRPFFFISSLIIEKEHLASFCCRKQEEKSSGVRCLSGISRLCSPAWVLFNTRSTSPSSHLHPDTKTRSIPWREPRPTHTVVTLITTSRLAAALIRGSLGRSWLRMCKMVYPQWWFRIVLNLLLCRPPLLLARPWGLPREPRAPVLLLELTGSPKSFDFS